MNGKQAKRLRAASKQVYIDKVVPELQKAAHNGRLIEAMEHLPTPKALYKSAKRKLTRGTPDG